MRYKFYEYYAPGSLEDAISILKRYGIEYRIRGANIYFLTPPDASETIAAVRELEALRVFGSFGNVCFCGSESNDIDAFLELQEKTAKERGRNSDNKPSICP